MILYKHTVSGYNVLRGDGNRPGDAPPFYLPACPGDSGNPSDTVRDARAKSGTFTRVILWPMGNRK
jgi:hypothetical protein